MLPDDAGIIHAVIRGFSEFCRLRGINPNNYSLDLIKLAVAVRRFKNDIARAEQSHELKGSADGHKLSGFLMYWLTRLQPIAVTDMSEYRRAETPMYINEEFAISCALTVLKITRNAEVTLSRKYVGQLRYTLKYRTVTRDLLATICYHWEQTG